MGTSGVCAGCAGLHRCPPPPPTHADVARQPDVSAVGGPANPRLGARATEYLQLLLPLAHKVCQSNAHAHGNAHGVAHGDALAHAKGASAERGEGLSR